MCSGPDLRASALERLSAWLIPLLPTGTGTEPAAEFSDDQCQKRNDIPQIGADLADYDTH